MTYVLEYFAVEVGSHAEAEFSLERKACWRLLKHLTEAMVDQSQGWLTVEEVESRVSRFLGLDQATSTAFVRRLVADGVLVQQLQWVEEGPIDTITYPYQRFGDHLRARHLLGRYLDTSSETALRRCLYVNQPLGAVFRVDDWGQSYDDPGLAEALMIEFPERLKRTSLASRELLWCLPAQRRLVEPLVRPFLDGLHWRSPSAFSEGTDRIVAFLLERTTDYVRDDTLEVLCGLACRPQHPYAAGRLYEYLQGLSMPERDLVWSEFLRRSDDEGAIRKLLDWIETVQGRKRSAEVVGNEMDLLSICLTTTVRPLRDAATRALVFLGCQHPDQLFARTLESLSWNDPYVPERMLAASFGVAMRTWAAPEGGATRASLGAFARELVESMLRPDSPFKTTHTLMLTYATGIVELARKVDPHCIANQYVKYTRGSLVHVPSSFPHPNSIDASVIEDAKFAVRMDFDNYTTGRLIPERQNYDSNHPEYVEVRSQILWRINDLGYRQEGFKEIDELVGRYNWNQDNETKVDRYGKKYSWIAFYEMYGYRLSHGLRG